MKDLLILLAHLLTTVAKLLGPGGARAVVADSLLMKQQLLVISRSRRRAPNLSALDRVLLGFWSLFLDPRRIQRAAVIIQPSTLLNFTICSSNESIVCCTQQVEKESQDPKVHHPNLSKRSLN
jgi:putative transposase